MQRAQENIKNYESTLLANNQRKSLILNPQSNENDYSSSIGKLHNIEESKGEHTSNVSEDQNKAMQNTLTLMNLTLKK